LPEEARELASYFALVIDTTTDINSKRFSATQIRCFEKGCAGIFRVEYCARPKSVGCAQGERMKEKLVVGRRRDGIIE